MKKLKKCKNCGKEFEPFQTTQKACGHKCAYELVQKDRDRAEKKALRERKKEFKVNDRATQLKLAQAAFNRFIRIRDKWQPCISCGRYHEGQIHAGHYRSVGAARHLRFNQFNVNAQCAPCNNHKSGNAIEYRIRLVQKFGLAKVQWLESQNKPIKLSLDEIIAIKNYYNKLARRLKNGGIQGIESTNNGGTCESR